MAEVQFQRQNDGGTIYISFHSGLVLVNLFY